MREQKSFYPTPDDIERDWFVVDATDKVVGRIATKISDVIRGKNKASFTPSVDMGDFVVVINADKVRLTGNKEDQKVYYDHSRYPGGLKEKSFKSMKEKNPTDILYRAVKGMLPHNKLGAKQLTKLKLYVGNEHPHEAQNPKVLEV